MSDRKWRPLEHLSTRILCERLQMLAESLKRTPWNDMLVSEAVERLMESKQPESEGGE